MEINADSAFCNFPSQLYYSKEIRCL